MLLKSGQRGDRDAARRVRLLAARISIAFAAAKERRKVLQSQGKEELCVSL